MKKMKVFLWATTVVLGCFCFSLNPAKAQTEAISIPTTISSSAVWNKDCDYVEDGRINMSDWRIFRQDWGRIDCANSAYGDNVCKCDLNRDGECDTQDYSLFGNCWGTVMAEEDPALPTTAANPVWNKDCDYVEDGLINMSDWRIFRQDWGRTDCAKETFARDNDICECDLNRDGKCDMVDYLAFGKCWGTKGVAGCNYKPGDANNDGKIDASDVRELQRLIGTTNPNLCGGDCNGDGAVDIRDLRCINEIMGVCSFEPGDANQDGLITNTDMFKISNFYYTQEGEKNCSMDCNKDGTVTPADVICVKNKINSGCAFLPGDANHDGAITCADIPIINSNLGKTSDICGFDCNGNSSVDTGDMFCIKEKIPNGCNYNSIFPNPTTQCSKFDVNYDGRVTDADSKKLEEAFGSACAVGFDIRADFDKNGVVNILDKTALRDHRGVVASGNYDKLYDINADGSVDIYETTAVAKAFGQACTSGFNPKADFNNDCVINILDKVLMRDAATATFDQKFDLDKDGDIDEADQAILGVAFGKSCGKNYTRKVDFNYDCVINILDKVQVRNHLGRAASGNYNAIYDLDNDGDVDDYDQGVMNASFGKTCNANFNILADFNYDGQINIVDKVLLRDSHCLNFLFTDSTNSSSVTLASSSLVIMPWYISFNSEMKPEIYWRTGLTTTERTTCKVSVSKNKDLSGAFTDQREIQPVNTYKNGPWNVSNFRAGEYSQLHPTGILPGGIYYYRISCVAGNMKAESSILELYHLHPDFMVNGLRVVKEKNGYYAYTTVLNAGYEANTKNRHLPYLGLENPPKTLKTIINVRNISSPNSGENGDNYQVDFGDPVYKSGWKKEVKIGPLRMTASTTYEVVASVVPKFYERVSANDYYGRDFFVTDEEKVFMELLPDFTVSDIKFRKKGDKYVAVVAVKNIGLDFRIPRSADIANRPGLVEFNAQILSPVSGVNGTVNFKGSFEESSYPNGYVNEQEIFELPASYFTGVTPSPLKIKVDVLQPAGFTEYNRLNNSLTKDLKISNPELSLVDINLKNIGGKITVFAAINNNGVEFIPVHEDTGQSIRIATLLEMPSGQKVSKLLDIGEGIFPVGKSKQIQLAESGLLVNGPPSLPSIGGNTTYPYVATSQNVKITTRIDSKLDEASIFSSITKDDAGYIAETNEKNNLSVKTLAMPVPDFIVGDVKISKVQGEYFSTVTVKNVGDAYISPSSSLNIYLKLNEGTSVSEVYTYEINEASYPKGYVKSFNLSVPADIAYGKKYTAEARVDYKVEGDAARGLVLEKNENNNVLSKTVVVPK